jgi:hypothetical protein
MLLSSEALKYSKPCLIESEISFDFLRTTSLSVYIKVRLDFISPLNNLLQLFSIDKNFKCSHMSFMGVSVYVNIF